MQLRLCIPSVYHQCTARLIYNRFLLIPQCAYPRDDAITVTEEKLQRYLKYKQPLLRPPHSVHISYFLCAISKVLMIARTVNGLRCSRRQFFSKSSVFFELNSVFSFFFCMHPPACMNGRKKISRPKIGRILPLFGGLKRGEKKKKT